MAGGVSEADWKLFRSLREEALEHYCAGVLEELARVCEDRSPSAHERYLEVWSILRERDEVIRRTFDNPRRSTMHVSLAAIDALGLVSSSQLRQMTAETQAIIENLREVRSKWESSR